MKQTQATTVTHGIILTIILEVGSSSAAFIRFLFLSTHIFGF